MEACDVMKYFFFFSLNSNLPLGSLKVFVLPLFSKHHLLCVCTCLLLLSLFLRFFFFFFFVIILIYVLCFYAYNSLNFNLLLIDYLWYIFVFFFVCVIKCIFLACCVDEIFQLFEQSAQKETENFYVSFSFEFLPYFTLKKVGNLYCSKRSMYC